MSELRSVLFEAIKLQVTQLRFEPGSVGLKLLTLMPTAPDHHRPLYSCLSQAPRVRELDCKLVEAGVSQLGPPQQNTADLGA